MIEPFFSVSSVERNVHERKKDVDIVIGIAYLFLSMICLAVAGISFYILLMSLVK